MIRPRTVDFHGSSNMSVYMASRGPTLPEGVSVLERPTGSEVIYDVQVDPEGLTKERASIMQELLIWNHEGISLLLHCGRCGMRKEGSTRRRTPKKERVYYVIKCSKKMRSHDRSHA